MGVRSRRAALAGAETCSVERFPNELRIQPYRNGGPSGPDRGYIPLGHERVVSPRPQDASAIGRTVREMLQPVASDDISTD
jgi:hypothetical protein